MFGIRISRQPKSIEQVKLQSNYNTARQQDAARFSDEWMRCSTPLNTGSTYSMKDYERGNSRQSFCYDQYNNSSRNTSRADMYLEQQQQQQDIDVRSRQPQYFERQQYEHHQYQELPNREQAYLQKNWKEPQNDWEHQHPSRHHSQFATLDRPATQKRASRARSRTFGGGGNNESRAFSQEDTSFGPNFHPHMGEQYESETKHGLVQSSSFHTTQPAWNEPPRASRSIQKEDKKRTLRARNRSVVDFRTFMFGTPKPTENDDTDVEEETPSSNRKKNLARRSEDILRAVSSLSSQSPKRSFDFGRLSRASAAAASTDVEDETDDTEEQGPFEKNSKKLKHKLKKWLKKPISQLKRFSLQETTSDRAMGYQNQSPSSFSNVSFPTYKMHKRSTAATLVQNENESNNEDLNASRNDINNIPPRPDFPDSDLRQRIRQDFESDEGDNDDSSVRHQHINRHHQHQSEDSFPANYMYNQSQMTLESKDECRDNQGYSQTTLDSRQDMAEDASHKNTNQRLSALLEPVPFARESPENDDFLDDYYGQASNPGEEKPEQVPLMKPEQQRHESTSSAAIRHLDSLLSEIDAEIQFYESSRRWK